MGVWDRESRVMTIMAYLLFATAFAAACWTIWATVAPRARLIVALLVHGPLDTVATTLPAARRGSGRGAITRPDASRPAPLRAAA